MKTLIRRLLPSSILCFFCFLALFSCRTMRMKYTVSRNIAGQGKLSAVALASFFMKRTPDADSLQVKRLAELYVTEAAQEGINSDVAFAQMCLETGYLKFGNLVTPDMHNYCGLGAIDAEHPGERFETEQLGVRAHIQHLHAYGTTEDKTLVNPLVDTRYKWVRPRGKAPTVFELAGTWASDRQYGVKLKSILEGMETGR